jgi:hypothetical protein
VRDNDRAYGTIFTYRVRAMGIRDRPISPRSPWQNSHMERLIGTLRRECLDRMLIFGEAHLCRFLLRMRRITIRRARTWHYRKMPPSIEPSTDLAPSSPFRSWLGCITNSSGCDFRKGQVDSLKELDLKRPIREEIWFADEARVGQKNKITRRWAKRGSRLELP